MNIKKYTEKEKKLVKIIDISNKMRTFAAEIIDITILWTFIHTQTTPYCNR